MPKRTKIIATIGPASSSPAIIARLIHAGMDAARLNFSHGDWNEHTRRIRLIRDESEKAGKPIAIIQDLQGPKLRIGAVQNDAVTLRRGDTLMLTKKKVTGDARAYFRDLSPPYQGPEERRHGAPGRRKARAQGPGKGRRRPPMQGCAWRRAQEPQRSEPAGRKALAAFALSQGQGRPPIRHRAGCGLYRALVRAHSQGHQHHTSVSQNARRGHPDHRQDRKTRGHPEP